MRFEDIDWNGLRKKIREERSAGTKTAADWDRKAPSFARRNTDSLYADKFIEMLDPRPGWKVLDVGCGPGTLALPLAGRVNYVTALDFSGQMLAILEETARDRNITNVATRKLSWDDDWQEHGVGTHDAAIASRSLSVGDLRSALEKLTASARETCVVTDMVGTGPFDPDAFAAVGRPLKSGPDYIYTVNLLYQMGYRASVNFIHLEKDIPCASPDEALDIYTWMFHDLTETEKNRLQDYVTAMTSPAPDGGIILHREYVPTWAFIRWQP